MHNTSLSFLKVILPYCPIKRIFKKSSEKNFQGQFFTGEAGSILAPKQSEQQAGVLQNWDFVPVTQISAFFFLMTEVPW